MGESTLQIFIITLKYNNERPDPLVFKASVAIEDARLLAGELPPRQLRMVQVWVDLHREELLADWELAMDGVEPFRIDPLK